MELYHRNCRLFLGYLGATPNICKVVVGSPVQRGEHVFFQHPSSSCWQQHRGVTVWESKPEMPSVNSTWTWEATLRMFHLYNYEKVIAMLDCQKVQTEGTDPFAGYTLERQHGSLIQESVEPCGTWICQFWSSRWIAGVPDMRLEFQVYWQHV